MSQRASRISSRTYEVSVGIRMAPNFDRVPHTVERHLLPHERQVLTVRLHPSVLIKPVAISPGALPVALLVSMAPVRGHGRLGISVAFPRVHCYPGRRTH